MRGHARAENKGRHKMKKYVILTSLLALSACGGGSGGGGASVPLSPVTPTPSTTPVVVSLQGFSGGQQVNTENAELTNMSSYTVDYATDESTSKAAIEAYVAAHLTGGSTDLLNRSATRRSPSMRAAAATRDAFAEADAAITQMKQVVYDIVNMGTDETNINAYVTAHKDAMVNALLLLGRSGVNSSMTNSELLDELDAARQAIGTAYGSEISSTNIMDVLDWFDETNFGISKQKMDTVRLKDTGQDAFFKFALDDTGKITSVSLWENTIGEYGNTYTTGANRARIYIATSGEHAGEAVYEIGAGVVNLNPFGTDDNPYANSDAGDLSRNGNTFSNNVNFYSFVIDGKEFEIISQHPLTVAQMKARLKNEAIQKANKTMHSQNSAESESYVSELTDDVNDLFAAIDAYSFTEDDSGNIVPTGVVSQVATMTGMGKGFGSDGSKKLSYADFGYSTLTRTMGNESETNHLTYAGGYDARRMTPGDTANLLADNSTFTGTAMVTVEDNHDDKVNNDNDRFTATLYRDDTAQLKYNVDGSHNVTSTLTMANLKAIQSDGDDAVALDSDWYTTVVSRDESTPNIVKYRFDSTNANNTPKNIAAVHQFFTVDGTGNIIRNEAEPVAVDNQIVKTDVSNNNINTSNNGTVVTDNFALHGNFEVNYYGADKHSPTEATAGIYMAEHYHDGTGGTPDTVQHEVSVYGVFGGLKD